MWRHIVIEGYCLSTKEPPCNRRGVSTFCLGSGKTCPYLGFVDSNEREAAYFAPLHLILWDRITEKVTGFYWRFWPPYIFKPSKAPTSAECPSFSDSLQEAERSFQEWFKDAQGQEVKDDRTN